MSYDVVELTLPSDVANGGSFTVGYPTNADPGSYALGFSHYIRSNTYGRMNHADKVSFSFGASSVTITNNSGVTLLAQTKFWVQFDKAGGNLDAALAAPARMSEQILVEIHLGAPDTAVANGVIASQAITAANGPSTGINGSLAVGGVATFDQPRNVVAAWTGTAVMTITGTDEYGAKLVESSASGTSFAGKKAFKTITRVQVSADVTGATVGSGDVLGLPVFLSDIGRVMRELQDGVAAAAGTIVKGAYAKATATTGDVRGTYDPSAACDGAKAFTLFLAVDAPGNRGVAQYAG